MIQIPTERLKVSIGYGRFRDERYTLRSGRNHRQDMAVGSAYLRLLAKRNGGLIRQRYAVRPISTVSERLDK